MCCLHPQFLLNGSFDWYSGLLRKLASRELTRSEKHPELRGLEGDVCLDPVCSSMKGTMWPGLEEPACRTLHRLADADLLPCDQEGRKEGISKPVLTERWRPVRGYIRTPQLVGIKQ